MRVGLGLLGRRPLLQRQRLSDPDRALGRDLVGHRQLAQPRGEQLPQRRDVRVGLGVLGRRLLLHRHLACSDPDRALGRDLVGHRRLAQHQRHAVQRALSRDVRVGIGVLGRRQLLHRHRFSDSDRALGRDLVGHRHLAQHQRYAGKRPLWRDVRVGVGVLGRRLLLHRQLHSSDPDRALGRDLVGHRQLAQHQHYAGQLPPSREMRVGVGVLGRWRLLRQLRHRPDASVEVHGEPNPNTNTYSYSYSDSESDPDANAHSDADTYSNSYPDANTDGDTYSYTYSKNDSDTNAYGNANTNTDSDTNSDGDTIPNAHSHTDFNSNSYRDADSYTKAYSDTEDSPDAAASPNSAKVEGLPTTDHFRR